jgi:glycine/D-amino acid oxidase-like deaminating enzyme
MISIWEQEAFFAPQDVVIIGSGFAGLWSAFYLKKLRPRLKVTVVEKSLVPGSASTRNAGFACFGSLSELDEDTRRMGVDAMLNLVEMRFKGLQRIRKYFHNVTDYDHCGGYELFDDEMKYTLSDLRDAADYLNVLLKPITGKKNSFCLADKKLAAFGFINTKHLVKNNGEGYLHPGKLSRCLLQAVQGMGVQVFSGVKIESLQRKDGLLQVTGGAGLSFSAASVLVCTNEGSDDLLPGMPITPARGQVLLTSPIKNLGFRGAFHADAGYYYFRNLGDRVLLGGARNKAFDDERTRDTITSPFIQAELERYLAEIILPHAKGTYTIERRWSGIMGMGAEKTPSVKELQPRIFCATGLGGMGVAVAPIIGHRAAKLLLAG